MIGNETKEQIAVVQYCALRGIPVYAIPNGGSRNKIEAANLKRSGVKAGVPDLCFPEARNGYHGLYIEMKYGKNKTTPSQDAWLTLLNNNGYCVKVCYGFDAAKLVIDDYFSDIPKAP